jgi:type IV secretory pathway TrbF-like protein
VDRQTIGLAGLVLVAVLAGGLLWTRSQRKVTREAPLSDAEARSGRW